MQFESFKAMLTRIKSVAVDDKPDVITVTTLTQTDPFLTIRKSDDAIQVDLEKLNVSQVDFGQIMMALGTLYIQSIPAGTDAVTVIPQPDPEPVIDPSIMAVIKTNGDIAPQAGMGLAIDTDKVSVTLIKWLMNMFATGEQTDPILGILGLSRMVEGKWDYSANLRKASSPEN